MTAETYEIRVRGRLSESVAASFAGMQTSIEPVETVIYGPVTDQQALFGLLDRVQDLGLEVLEVRRVVSDSGSLTREQGP